MQANAKAGVKVAIDHALAPVFEHTTSSEAPAEHLNDFDWINTRFGTHCEGFGHAGNSDRNEDLITRFHGLPRAEGTAQNRALAHNIKERFDRVERICIPANHNGKRGILRADVATADGCIETLNAFSSEYLPYLCGDPGRNRAHIDKNQPLVCAFNNPVLAQSDALNIGRIGQHSDNDVTLLCHLFARVRFCCPSAYEFINCISIAVMHDEFISSIYQMPGHRLAHNPQTDKSDFWFRHVLNSFQSTLFSKVSTCFR